MRRLLLVLTVFVVSAPAAAGQRVSVPRAMSQIRTEDLRRDLYYLASDSMRGREGGTLDEMRASMWIADQLRAIGVEPMGDNGTYFQWFGLRRTRIAASSQVAVGLRTFTMWRDIAATSNGPAEVTAPTVWVADVSDTTIDLRGKVAIAQLRPPPQGGRQTSVNSPEYRYANSAIQNTGFALTRRGAAAVILVADETAEIGFQGVANIRSRGSYALDGVATGRGGGGRGNAQSTAPVLLVRRAMLDELRQEGKLATIRLFRESFTYPSVNIVGRIRGTDARLRDEYVLFSSHQDHDGVRYDIAGDSIWNGADDNGTTSVALLAIARAFKAQPGRRSALFVYHGAEERGLIGSRHHSATPVVPLSNIVAVLNGDMLGRNHPDSASLMGVQPPHLNSRELVAMAFAANNATGKFALDSIWDRPNHLEGWYFRSDHLPYARLNVPALFFSSNLHPDYHTPRDEPSTIDYAKLTRITQWMYLTGWLVATTEKRPGLEPGFRLER